MELNGNNYRKWRDDVEFYMGMHQNIDYCLLKPKPVGTEEENNMDADSSWHYYEWFRTNRMAKNVIRRTMSEVVRGSIEEPEDAIDFMANIAEKYEESEKAEAARLHKEFHELKYDGNGSVREHIMHKVQLNGKLRDLKMGVADAQLVHDALWSLPSTFSQLRSTYNALEVKWTINKLISVCVWMRKILSEEKLNHQLQLIWWRSLSGRRRIRTRLSRPPILRYPANLQILRVTSPLKLGVSSVKRWDTLRRIALVLRHG